jgi:hypothetical protein
MRINRMAHSQRVRRPPSSVLPSAPDGDEISGLKKKYIYPWAVALGGLRTHDNLFSKDLPAFKNGNFRLFWTAMAEIIKKRDKGQGGQIFLTP